MGRLPAIRRAVTIGTVLTAVLASPAAATREASEAPSLRVESVPLFEPLHIGLSTGTAPGLPARVEIDVPTGYSLALTDPRGTQIGAATLALVDASSNGGVAFANVELAVDDPAAYRSDADVQACAPGIHAAVWSGTAGVAGQTLRTLVFVDAGQGGGDRLVVCFSGLTGTSQISTGLDLVVGANVTSPTAPGTYTWRAIVTPRSGNAYELRALALLPSSVSLTARRDTKRRQAVLSGRATAGGRPLAHSPISVEVQVGNTIRSGFDAGATTGANGRFTIRNSIRTTSDYFVSVGEVSTACAAPSTAPGGCLSQTIVPPPPAFATVFVSRKADPRRAYTTSGQKRAASELPRAADLPAGATAVGPGIHGCDTHHADEQKLTISGEAQSPVYASGTAPVAGDQSTAQLVELSTTTRVYRTIGDARAALAAEARAAYARCALGGAPGPMKTSSGAFPQHPATVRAFRGKVDLGGLTGVIELVFVERGRSVARIVAFGLGMEPRAVTLPLARKLAARLR